MVLFSNIIHTGNIKPQFFLSLNQNRYGRYHNDVNLNNSYNFQRLSHIY